MDCHFDVYLTTFNAKLHQPQSTTPHQYYKQDKWTVVAMDGDWQAYWLDDLELLIGSIITNALAAKRSANFSRPCRPNGRVRPSGGGANKKPSSIGRERVREGFVVISGIGTWWWWQQSIENPNLSRH